MDVQSVLTHEIAIFTELHNLKISSWGVNAPTMAGGNNYAFNVTTEARSLEQDDIAAARFLQFRATISGPDILV